MQSLFLLGALALVTSSVAGATRCDFEHAFVQGYQSSVDETPLAGADNWIDFDFRPEGIMKAHYVTSRASYNEDFGATAVCSGFYTENYDEFDLIMSCLVGDSNTAFSTNSLQRCHGKCIADGREFHAECIDYFPYPEPNLNPWASDFRSGVASTYEFRGFITKHSDNPYLLRREKYSSSSSSSSSSAFPSADEFILENTDFLGGRANADGGFGYIPVDDSSSSSSSSSSS